MEVVESRMGDVLRRTSYTLKISRRDGALVRQCVAQRFVERERLARHQDLRFCPPGSGKGKRDGRLSIWTELVSRKEFERFKCLDARLVGCTLRQESNR